MHKSDAEQPRDESLLNLDEIMQAFNVAKWENLGPLETLHGENQGMRVSIDGLEYVLRERPQEPGEVNIRFRYAFQCYLRQEGIPIPAFRETPAGESAVRVGDEYVELQPLVRGELFSSASPHSLEWIAGAAAMLGRIHQASQQYHGEQYHWPSEVHIGAIVHNYLRAARTRAETSQLPAALTSGLGEWADRWEAALPPAMVSLGAHHRLPAFHIHGDYHALNLRFGPFGVSAVTGFETAHWEKRIFEVAMALFYFCGLSWLPGSDVTSPLLKRGLNPERMRTFLQAYSEYGPPVSGEADLLVDALTVVSPLIILNGPLESLFYETQAPDEIDLDTLLGGLTWATALPAWLGRVRRSIADMWSD